MAENNHPKEMEMREAFGRALVDLGREEARIVVLDADLNTSSKTVLFKKAFPDRFFQIGIAEQNLFGVAAGLALEGYIPFPGSYVGLPTSRAGASHNCIEDLAIMRSLPNMRVADPGDNADLRAIMRTALEGDGPVYFRVTRLTLPDLFGPEHRFEWGQGVIVHPGKDVTLFGTGMMTSLCLQAADQLANEGIEAEVVHLASIKPIDCDLILDSVSRTGCAVTAENASILGGMGSAVMEVIAENCPVPVRRIGVRDRWVDSGGIDELFTLHHMQPVDIALAARESIRSKISGRVR